MTNIRTGFILLAIVEKIPWFNPASPVCPFAALRTLPRPLPLPFPVGVAGVDVCELGLPTVVVDRIADCWLSGTVTLKVWTPL